MRLNDRQALVAVCPSLSAASLIFLCSAAFDSQRKPGGSVIPVIIAITHLAVPIPKPRQDAASSLRWQQVQRFWPYQRYSLLKKVER